MVKEEEEEMMEEENHHCHPIKLESPRIAGDGTNRVKILKNRKTRKKFRKPKNC